MSEELKPCSVCHTKNQGLYEQITLSANKGETKNIVNIVCRCCGNQLPKSKWNTRPIEDTLRRQSSEEREKVKVLTEALEMIASIDTVFKCNCNHICNCIETERDNAVNIATEALTTNKEQ